MVHLNFIRISCFAVLLTTLLAVQGCVTIPPLSETQYNRVEPDEEMFVLPANWAAPYRRNLDLLIGVYIALVPDATSPTGFKTEILDQAITDKGVKAIIKEALDSDQPLYKSRVQATFAPTLSFIVGRVEINNDSLYDLTLVDSNRAILPPDSMYVDPVKKPTIWKRLPAEFRALFFVTAVTHRTLTVKQYKHYKGKGEAVYSLIKLGTDYYYGDESTSVKHVFYFAGLNDGALFGDFDPQRGTYKKKKSINAKADKGISKGIVQKKFSEDTVDVFKKTLRYEALK